MKVTYQGNMQIKVTCDDQDLIPKYQTHGSAAADLMSGMVDDVIINPGGYALIKTGLCIELPEGTCARILPRSGLALKKGIDVHHGLIDCDFRGEIGVILKNNGSEEFTVSYGDRIAQMLIQEHVRTSFVQGDLGETERGEGGFGSSGV